MRTIIFSLILIIISCNKVSLQTITESWISNPALLESFFDGMMNDHLKSKRIAGAVVAVVKDGNIVLKKGYGYSDYENKRPVSPDSSLFRIGSISKTFTWIAVMQLAAQGKLNLDEDVNNYLTDFRIPDGKGGPITLRNLMTHTPGFEDRLLGIFGRDEKSIRPYGEILKEELPERVRPSGVEMSYSNHGTGIAAYIVENVSGLKWNEYVEQNIIKPLGMDHTTFRQPLPDHLAEMVSKGYNYENGSLKEYGFEFIPLAAVGGASSTADDMARYMITHLQFGKYNDISILDSASFSRIHGIEFKASPFVSGIGLGIYELVNWNGIRTIGHGGDTFWFHSIIALIPEKNLGLFVSFNTQTADYAQVLLLFLNHFSPLKPPKQEIKLTSVNSEKYTGEYRYNRYPHSDMTRISSILSPLKVSYDTSGYLIARGVDSQKWFMVNDSTFIKESGDEYFAFGEMQDGRYTKIFPGNLAVMPMERLPFIDSGSLHIVVLAVWMLVFLFTFIHWPLVYLIRRKYSLNPNEQQTLPVFNKWIGWITSLLVLLFIIGLMSSLSKPWELAYGVSPALKIVLVIPLVLCILVPVLIYMVFKLTISKGFRLSGKIHFYVLTFSLLLFLLQLNHWNMLGFKY